MSRLSLAVLGPPEIRAAGQPYAHLRDGRHAEGIALARQCLTLSQSINNSWGQASALLHLARGLLETGEFTEALRAAERGLAVAGGTAYVNGLLRVMLGSIHRALYNLDRARALHQEALAEAAAQGLLPAYQSMVTAELCADCMAAQEWDDAKQFARQTAAHRSYTVLPSGNLLWPEVLALTWAGEADLADGLVRRYEIALGNFRRHQVSLLRAQAIRAGARGDFGAAVGCLRSATALAEAIGLPDELWQLYAAQGKMQQAAEIVQTLAGRIDDEALQAGFVSAAPFRQLF